MYSRIYYNLLLIGFDFGGILIAPSKRMVVPFKYVFLAQVKTSSPNSLKGSPNLGGATTSAINPFLTSSGIIATIGVLNTPGAMVTTRIPKGPRSLAIGKVIPTTPPLEAL